MCSGYKARLVIDDMRRANPMERKATQERDYGENFRLSSEELGASDMGLWTPRGLGLGVLRARPVPPRPWPGATENPTQNPGSPEFHRT